MSKWRVEYQVSTTDQGPRTTWRVYVDGIAEGFEPYAMSDVIRHVQPEHPAYKYINGLMRDTHDRVFVKPYEPFELCDSVSEIMDAEWIDRICAKDECCKVWSSKDLWTWLHYPGDSCR